MKAAGAGATVEGDDIVQLLDGQQDG